MDARLCARRGRFVLHRPLDQSTQAGKPSHKSRLPHCLPLRTFKQRMERAQISIVKRHQPLVTPKTDSVHNCGVAMSGIADSTRRQKFVNVPQCNTHFADGMEHICAENEIERAGLEALFGARLFEIKNFELHLRKGR